jgi:hypothetical protein
MPKPPHNVAALDRAIRQMAGSDRNAVEVRRGLANVIAGQFLDGAVMRGGGALKLRYGTGTTRITEDFDASRKVAEDEFVASYNQRLAEGWAGFTGRLVKEDKAHPRDVPDAYVMQPFEVKLAYRNHPWCTVDLELSYNEVGDADEADIVSLPEDVRSLFPRLGLPEPRPVPLMRIPHQIAQKLHGVTDRSLSRVQDLIDLQLMASHEGIDFAEVDAICKRLFANRKRQPWPSPIVPRAGWPQEYEGMGHGMEGLLPFEEAVEWGNRFIREISEAGDLRPQ